MGRIVTLELPERIAARAAAAAESSNRRVEDVVHDWLGQFADDPPIGWLTDAEVLALARSRMPAAEGDELADLLWDQNAGQLTPEKRARLDLLMLLYKSGQLRMAQGYAEAVRRGLLPRGPYGRP